jgi:peptidoglycan/xylan/chitin deacetylase (PgdA/CDA1 family)
MHRIILTLIFFLFTIQHGGSKENNDVDKTIFFWKIDTKEKVVFLTFDDGPGKYTEDVLQLLKKYNIKATFFMLGEVVKYYPDFVRKVYESGHSIASHTYYHNNFYKLQKKLSVDECKKKLDEELKMTEEEIKKILPQVKIKFLRMPNGYYKNWVSDIAKKYGYKIVNWTFGCDWHNYTEEEMVKRYKEALQPGCIYLFHDGGKNRRKTVNVLHQLIEHYISNGYKIESLEGWIK